MEDDSDEARSKVQGVRNPLIMVPVIVWRLSLIWVGLMTLLLFLLAVLPTVEGYWKSSTIIGFVCFVQTIILIRFLKLP